MTDTSNEPRASVMWVDRSGSEQAIRALVRAFKDREPFLSYHPDQSRREKVAYFLIAMAVLPALRYGEVHASSGAMEGVAVWVPSENYPVSAWRLLRAAPLSVTWGFARNGGYKMKGLGQYIDALHARLAPFRHMYLQSIGVDPDHQGQGHAGRLLRHMLDRMDEAGLPTYLETAEPENVGLYEHFGFAVIDQSTIPGSRLTNWAMLRKATPRN
jgi:ribosomal protein S18 acetylase RimI-like enzyme